MKQRKNAFTLIELLAVIVILAIIALIATPIILNIIEKSKKSAFVDSAYGLIEAAKLEYTQGLLHNTSTAKSYRFSENETSELEFSGSKPTGGTLNITETGQVSLAIHNGDWCITKSNTDSEVTVSKYEMETCVLPETESSLEKCYQVEDHEEVEYTINKEACMNYVSDWDFDEETDVEIFCSGDTPSDGYSMDVIIKTDFIGDFIEELKTAGVITITSKTIDGVTITKYNKNNEECEVDVVIPETIGGKPVKAIKNYAFVENWDGDYNNYPTIDDSKKMNSIVFPSGLEVIGYNAFLGSRNKIVFNEITNVDFSKANNLQIIEDGVFNGNQLTNVDLSNLTNLTFLSGFSNNLISKVELNNLPNLQIMGGNAFRDNQLTTVDLSNLTNLQVIAWDTFYRNQLTSLILPESVTAIGDYAFSVNQLTSVTVPSNVMTIGYGAFVDNKLTKVIINGKCNTNDFLNYPSPTSNYPSPFSWNFGDGNPNFNWPDCAPTELDDGPK